MVFDHEAYRRRSIMECCVGWLKECRRITTRFEKLAVSFLALLCQLVDFGVGDWR